MAGRSRRMLTGAMLALLSLCILSFSGDSDQVKLKDLEKRLEGVQKDLSAAEAEKASQNKTIPRYIGCSGSQGPVRIRRNERFSEQKGRQ